MASIPPIGSVRPAAGSLASWFDSPGYFLLSGLPAHCLGRLDLVLFHDFQSFNDVAVDIGAVGVFEGGADEGARPGSTPLSRSMRS